MHGGGAARIAYEEFGAEWGVGVGMTGQCYAISTMDGCIDIIRKHVDDFTAYAKAHPELTFLVTRIACGIAGWRDSEIAPLFKEVSHDFHFRTNCTSCTTHTIHTRRYVTFAFNELSYPCCRSMGQPRLFLDSGQRRVYIRKMPIY